MNKKLLPYAEALHKAAWEYEQAYRKYLKQEHSIILLKHDYSGKGVFLCSEEITSCLARQYKMETK